MSAAGTDPAPAGLHSSNKEGERPSIRLGAIADDFTGATDLATALVESGFRTSMFIGVDEAVQLSDADAVVVALKTRTPPADQAVSVSRKALTNLR